MHDGQVWSSTNPEGTVLYVRPWKVITLFRECVRYYHELETAHGERLSKQELRRRTAFAFGLHTDTIQWMLQHAQPAGRCKFVAHKKRA